MVQHPVAQQMPGMSNSRAAGRRAQLKVGGEWFREKFTDIAVLASRGGCQVTCFTSEHGGRRSVSFARRQRRQGLDLGLYVRAGRVNNRVTSTGLR